MSFKPQYIILYISLLWLSYVLNLNFMDNVTGIEMSYPKQ